MCRHGLVVVAFACSAAVSMATDDAKPSSAPTAPTGLAPIALPGAAEGGVALDYIAIDRSRHRVWVPAGGTGNVDVIDTTTQKIQAVAGFATSEVERQGRKRKLGPSSATVGDGFVYVGNRADSSVCALDASSLARAGRVTLPGMIDGVVYVSSTHEVWVTAPRAKTMFVLDVAKPDAPKIAAHFTLEGEPEGYAVDNAHGAFYTNLEDKDRTLRIDL